MRNKRKIIDLFNGYKTWKKYFEQYNFFLIVKSHFRDYSKSHVQDWHDYATDDKYETHVNTE